MEERRRLVESIHQLLEEGDSRLRDPAKPQASRCQDGETPSHMLLVFKQSLLL